jgi:HK97 family phage major capsid protein
MSRIAKMLDKRAKLVEEMESIAEAASNEDRDLSSAEQKAFDEREEEMKRLDAQIEVEKRLQAAKAATATPVDVVGNQARASVPAQARYRHGKLKAFKGANAEEDAYTAGMFLRATVLRGLPGMERVAKGAEEWLMGRGIDIHTRAASGGQNDLGGYVVPHQFETAIIDLREEYGTFRRNVPVLPMSSDTMSMPRRAGGLTAYFVDENASITDSDKTWSQVNFVAKKLAALTRISSEIAEDAIISIADDLANEMAYAFALTEDRVGWNGTGIATDGGIIGVRTKFTAGLGTLVGAVDAASGRDTFAELQADDLRKVMSVVPAYARRNAKWYGSQVAWELTFLPLIQAAGGLTGEELGRGFAKRYLGYEFVTDQTMPITQGDLSDVPMIGFGDLGLACKMAQRRGISIASSDQRYFENDQTAIRATERIDLVVHDIGTTTAAGPFAMLMGE